MLDTCHQALSASCLSYSLVDDSNSDDLTSSLLKHTNVIYFHRKRQQTVVYPFLTTPLATPSQVENDIKRLIERLRIPTRSVILIGKDFLAVHIKCHLMGCPLHGIDMKVSCLLDSHITMFDWRATIVVFVTVNG